MSQNYICASCGNRIPGAKQDKSKKVKSRRQKVASPLTGPLNEVDETKENIKAPALNLSSLNENMNPRSSALNLNSLNLKNISSGSSRLSTFGQKLMS